MEGSLNYLIDELENNNSPTLQHSAYECIKII